MLTLKRLQARIENQFLPRDVDHIGGPIVERNTTTRVKTEIDSPIVISSSLTAAACESSAAMTQSQKESWTIETQNRQRICVLPSDVKQEAVIIVRQRLPSKILSLAFLASD